MKKFLGVCLIALVVCPSVLFAELKLPGIFSDNLVIQRDKPVPVWGWAEQGAEVTVAFAGQKKTAKVAATNGEWRVTLDPIPACSAPQTMTVTSSNLKSEISNLKFTNVLIGDVWLCSGQSNMEMPVGYVSWTGGALNYEEEIKNSANPLIRQFRVEWDRRGYSPKYGDGTWLTAGPETTDKFSATGYFFARELQKKRKVPVAIIHASQGATAIEWWMSREAMLADPECRRQVESQTEDFKFWQFRRLKEWAAKHEVWEEKYGRTDAGAKGSVDEWVAAPKDGSGWKKVSLPGSSAGIGCRSGGVLWLRREVELPAVCTNGAQLWMGGAGDTFSVYVNSVLCGEASLTNGYGRRIYAFWIPKSVAREGRNVVAFRARSFLGVPAFRGNADQFKIKSGASETALAGEWLAKVETEFAALPRGADARPVMENGPGIHYYYTAIKFDWVIRPLIPYALNGVVWYQGEHNTGRPQEYRKLIKMFVNDWRNQWHCPDLPFYICQLPNNGKKSELPEESGWAELREAQALALELPGVHLANLIDNAEDGDLHPRNKQEVGHRLALLAMANTYGDKSVACYGPMFDSMTIKDGKAVITFKHADDGLVARKPPATYRTDLKKPDSEVKPLVLPSPGSEVQGFAIYGATPLADGGTSNQWVWADAKIDGSTVVVCSDKVAKPVAVRYAWANNPVCNLYNKAGLPAYQFRTEKNGK
jgi:sialate O-acetylesterase